MPLHRSDQCGLGLGRRLLDALLAASEAAGFWTLQTSICPKNHNSLALHKHAGFRKVGRRDRIRLLSFGPIAGQWREVILLERRGTVAGV